MITQSTINITANGSRHELPAGARLVDFLEKLELSPRLVVVERNGQALTPAEARETILQAGDVLEIVRIVAGG